jgi:glutamate racemase
MNIIIIDSGLGGKNFIKKLKKNTKLKIHFVKPFDNMVSSYNKEYVRNNLLQLLNTFSIKKIHSIIIACHSASSCILDILIKNNFILNNIKIYEPIFPMCLYIKKKFKNIIILSTPLTQKIKWHYRLLNSNNINIKYITFPLLAHQIENHHKDFSVSIDRLKKQKNFFNICDCVVLGCTHYNIIKNIIFDELKNKYDFTGVILDSNDILLNYFIINT